MARFTEGTTGLKLSHLSYYHELSSLSSTGSFVERAENSDCPCEGAIAVAALL